MSELNGELESLRAEVRRIRDKEAIVELHERFAATLDAADYDGLVTVFIADGVLDGFGKETLRGATTIARRLREIGDRHLASQRMITNCRVALDGDAARAVAAFRSAHLDRGDEQHTHAHEGWYLSDLVRTDDGWRFSRLKRVNLTEVLEDPPAATAEDIYQHVTDRTRSF